MRRRRSFLASTALLSLALLRCTSEAWIGADEVTGELPEPLDGGARDGVPKGVADDAAPLPIPSVNGPFGLLVKAGPNGCGFGTWTEGSVSYVDATMSQDGSRVVAEIQGFAILTYGILVGTTRLEGTLDGPTLTLRSTGVIQWTLDGGCPHTVDATVTASVDGDALENGLVTFARNFGGAAACEVNRCTSTETLAGLRSTAVPAGDP